MASRLRVDEILPSVGNNIAIGTATGSVSFANATYTVGTGASVHSPASNTLTLGTNDNESVRILSNGYVGIGTTQPRAYLEVAGLAAPHLIVGHQAANAVQRQSRMSFGFSDGEGSCIQSTRPAGGTTENCDITFRTGGTTGQHERLGIGTDGNVSITNGNLVFQTSGTGIDFQNAGISSTTATAHILDDYEEGTFTVTYVTEGGTDLTMSTINDGVYTKIGRVVNFNFRIATSEFTSFPAGNMRIRGLPFAARSSTQQRDGGGAVTELYRWATNFVSANNLIQVTTINDTDQLRLAKMSSTTSSQVFIDETDMNTGTNQNIMAVCGHYYTDE